MLYFQIWLSHCLLEEINLLAALNEGMKKDKKIILVTQKNSEIDDPKKTDVFMYGSCQGNILQIT